MLTIPDAQKRSRAATRLSELYASLGNRLNKGLFDSLVNAQSVRPALTPSKVLAFIAAGLVHLLFLLVATTGVVLLLTTWPNPFFLFTGVLLVLIAWAIHPRFPQLSEEPIPPEAIPTIRKITDDTSHALGASNVEFFVIDDDFNAAFTRVGWRRKKALYLGLPFLHVLNSQERVAVIAHEVAHGVNGDPTRSLFVGTAINSLSTWYDILIPDRIWESDSDLFVLAAIPGNILRWVLAQAVGIFAMMLAHLVWRDMQRAEYLADHLAASVGGTDAMLAMLEKSHLGDIYFETVKAISLNDNKRDLFRELRHRFENASQHDIQRSKKLDESLKSRLDLTHPPTTYRMMFLNARPVSTPQVQLSPEEYAQMEQELASFQPRVQERIIDSHRDTLYY